MSQKQSVTRKMSPRLKRKLRIRKKIVGKTDRVRLCVYRSSKYTYAQIVRDSDGKTLVTASSREKEVMDRSASFQPSEDTSVIHSSVKSPKSVVGAFIVGEVLAERAKAAGLTQVVFDRNGFVYHGRIKAAAEGARSKGLEF